MILSKSQRFLTEKSDINYKFFHCQWLNVHTRLSRLLSQVYSIWGPKGIYWKWFLFFLKTLYSLYLNINFILKTLLLKQHIPSNFVMMIIEFQAHLSENVRFVIHICVVQSTLVLCNNWFTNPHWIEFKSCGEMLFQK